MTVGGGAAGDAGGGKASQPRWSAKRPRVLVAGVSVAVALVVLVGVVTRLTRQSGGSGATTNSLARQALVSTSQAPGINLATGELLSLDRFPGSGRVAPPFSLTDQHGRPVTLSEFRGRSVVLSFNDDQCQDLCPLLAQDIVAANRDLGPAARHVVWLSVNVNPFYPGVSAVKAWTDEHGLGNQSNWHFGTASPSRLEPIWKAYGIEVGLNRKARTVTHGTLMFFIDPAGRERALASFGTNDADTALFAHGLARMADDLLPRSEQAHRVGGPVTVTPTRANAALGATAPSFTLPYLLSDRGRFSLADLHGRYAVLSFWSSTCPACRAELPAVEAAYRRDGRRVSFVGIDVSDPPAAGRALATAAGLTYPLVVDRAGSAAGAERVSGLPYTVVLSPTGKILVRHPGSITTEELVYVLGNVVPSLGGGM